MSENDIEMNDNVAGGKENENESQGSNKKKTYKRKKKSKPKKKSKGNKYKKKSEENNVSEDDKDSEGDKDSKKGNESDGENGADDDKVSEGEKAAEESKKNLSKSQADKKTIDEGEFYSGKKVFNADVLKFFNDIKYHSQVKTIFKDYESGISHKNETNGFWGNRAHFLFMRTGKLHQQWNDVPEDEIESEQYKFMSALQYFEVKIKKCVYYRYIHYKFKDKSNQNSYVTYLHLRFTPQFKLSVTRFNEWVLLNTPNIKTIDSILIGNRSPGNHDNPFIRLCHVESNGFSRKKIIDELQDQANTGNQNFQLHYRIIENVRKLNITLDDEEEDLAEGHN